MLRNILGVIVGYIAMFAFIFITFTVAYLAMGADGAFQPGSYEVSMVWVIVSIVLGFAAAVLGGYICVIIARNAKAGLALAIVVLVLGILLAIPTLSEDPEAPTVRSDDVDSMAAMQSARQPSWLAFLNPVLGAAGVMVGTRLKKQPPPA